MSTLTLYLSVLTTVVELCWNADLSTEDIDPVAECVDQRLYLVELCWNADLAIEDNDPLPECVES
jgi:hypothetical protein